MEFHQLLNSRGLEPTQSTSNLDADERMFIDVVATKLKHFGDGGPSSETQQPLSGIAFLHQATNLVRGILDGQFKPSGVWGMHTIRCFLQEVCLESRLGTPCLTLR